MQNIIIIEHGENLGSWRTIHEHTLCNHSKSMRQLSADAELLREKYDKCKDILKLLGTIACVGLTPEHFEARKLDVKVTFRTINAHDAIYCYLPKCTYMLILMQLLDLMGSLENYPLQEYQKGIDKIVGHCMDEQFEDKNYLTSANRPKTSKSFQALSLKNRLSFLNAEGALATAEVIWIQLQKIENSEMQKSQTSKYKAWAQGRLRLRNATESSVLSLVEWAYHSTLREDGAEQLYDLWGLANRLGFDALAEICLDRLYDNAVASINDARMHGLSLLSLLGLSEKTAADSSVQSDAVVTTVFRHVLKDDNAPTKLSKLVIETLAQGVDGELWSHLSQMVSHNTTRKLIEAMIAHRHVKAEQDVHKGGDIKQESHHHPSSVVFRPTGSYGQGVGSE